ncbi:MAG: hypothetical protein ACKO2L_18140 [Planctomycetaceae bacterium]
MSFFELLAAAVTVFALVTVAVAILSIHAIAGWFRDRVSSGVVNRNRLCVTVLQQLRKGDYKVVQGIFDTNREQYVERRVVEAREIDQDFVRAHDQNGMAVWSVEG